MYIFDYRDIEKNYEEILKYCLKFSDTFSVITNLKKRRFPDMLFCEHDKITDSWNVCLEKQIAGITEWPGTKTKNQHKVIKIYNSKKFRKLILDVPNFFSAEENQLPEDVCFYRNEQPWLFTVSHEEMAIMKNETKSDLEFFVSLDIKMYKQS